MEIIASIFCVVIVVGLFFALLTFRIHLIGLQIDQEMREIIDQKIKSSRKD